jgi:uncharacterized protein (UPF0264 family)
MTISSSPQLLVSVRSAAEAEAALEGGAHVIDVKEPLRGPLGPADAAVTAAILEVVAGRRPVSAALGELADRTAATAYSVAGLTFVKWGLAGMGRVADWPCRLAEAQGGIREEPSCRAVVVAYADWEAAGAPPVEAVVAFARKRPGGVLLVDTFQKAPARDAGAAPTLLDLIPLRQLTALCRSCRDAGVRVALAGSLRAAHIRECKHVRPDWFAVRGAVCADGRREAAVSAGKVRALVELLA